MPNWHNWLVVAGRYFDDLASVFTDKVSEQSRTIGKYITQRKAEKAVTRSLLATMSVNRLQDTPYISVPNVAVCDSEPSHISVEVEKLAGMYDIEDDRRHQCQLSWEARRLCSHVWNNNN